MIDKWESDCQCCHHQERHAVDLVAIGRGRCLVKDCVHDCQVFTPFKTSAFFDMLSLVDGFLNREQKRKALLASDWDLEAWLDRYRSVPWPEKVTK